MLNVIRFYSQGAGEHASLAPCWVFVCNSYFLSVRSSQHSCTSHRSDDGRAARHILSLNSWAQCSWRGSQCFAPALPCPAAGMLAGVKVYAQVTTTKPSRFKLIQHLSSASLPMQLQTCPQAYALRTLHASTCHRAKTLKKDKKRVS